MPEFPRLPPPTLDVVQALVEELRLPFFIQGDQREHGEVRVYSFTEFIRWTPGRGVEGPFVRNFTVGPAQELELAKETK